MELKDAIRTLREQHFNHNVAQLKVDIGYYGKVCYENEDILIAMDEQAYKSVKPINGQFCTCKSIDEFVECCLPHADVSTYYVKNIKSISSIEEKYYGGDNYLQKFEEMVHTKVY
jgi:hypothetical protein